MALSIFGLGSLVNVEPEHRTGRPDSEGGKAFVVNVDGIEDVGREKLGPSFPY